VTAFAFQAVTSWFLSAVLELFLPDPLSHRSLRTARSVRRSLFSLTSLRKEIGRIDEDLRHLTHQLEEKARHVLELSTSLTSLAEEARRHLHDLTTVNAPHEVPHASIQENMHERSPRQEARSVVAEILYFSSDVQTLAGK